MEVPLTSLSAQTGDFDGDVENVYGLMERRCRSIYKGFSPRNLLLDRTGDRLINTDFLPIKDSYTIINTFLTPLRKQVS